MRPSLTIRMLGAFEVRFDAQDIIPHLKPCTAGLFAYLAWRSGKITSRDRLAEDLWRDLPADRALRALNTCVWRLRRVIADLGLDSDALVQSGAEGVGLNPDVVLRKDVETLEQMARSLAAVPVETVDEPFLAEVTSGLAQFGGEFLPGRYDDWCLMPREIFRNHVAALLEFGVLAHMHRGEWRCAIDKAQRLIDLDPMQERVHQWLITCYLKIDDRLRAKEQFEICAELIERELGVAPLPETAALINASLVSGRPPAPAEAKLSPKIRRALDNLDAAREAIVHLAHDLNHKAR